MSSAVSPSPNAVAAWPVSQARTETVYIFPPSFGQQQLWLLNRLLPDGSVYNVSAVVRLIGTLEIEALHEALRELVRRQRQSLLSWLLGLDWLLVALLIFGINRLAIDAEVDADGPGTLPRNRSIWSVARCFVPVCCAWRSPSTGCCSRCTIL